MPINIDKATDVILSLRSDINTLRGQLAQTQAQASQIPGLQQQLARAQAAAQGAQLQAAEIPRLQQQLQTEQAARQQAEQQATQIQRLQHQLTQAQRQNGQLQADLGARTAERDGRPTQQQLQAEQAARQQAEIERDGRPSQQQLDDLRAQLDARPTQQQLQAEQDARTAATQQARATAQDSDAKTRKEAEDAARAAETRLQEQLQAARKEADNQTATQTKLYSQWIALFLCINTVSSNPSHTHTTSKSLLSLGISPQLLPFWENNPAECRRLLAQVHHNLKKKKQLKSRELLPMHEVIRFLINIAAGAQRSGQSNTEWKKQEEAIGALQNLVNELPPEIQNQSPRHPFSSAMASRSSNSSGSAQPTPRAGRALEIQSQDTPAHAAPRPFLPSFSASSMTAGSSSSSANAQPTTEGVGNGGKEEEKKHPAA